MAPGNRIGVQIVIRDCFAESTGQRGKVNFDRIKGDVANIRGALEQIGTKNGVTFEMLPPEATISGGACMNKEDAAKHVRMIREKPVDAFIAYYANFGDLTAFSVAAEATKGLPLLMFGLPDDLRF